MVTSRIWFTAAQKAELWERWKSRRISRERVLSAFCRSPFSSFTRSRSDRMRLCHAHCYKGSL
jgi:hypothetical protein